MSNRAAERAIVAICSSTPAAAAPFVMEDSNAFTSGSNYGAESESGSADIAEEGVLVVSEGKEEQAGSVSPRVAACSVDVQSTATLVHMGAPGTEQGSRQPARAMKVQAPPRVSREVQRSGPVAAPARFERLQPEQASHERDDDSIKRCAEELNSVVPDGPSLEELWTAIAAGRQRPEITPRPGVARL